MPATPPLDADPFDRYGSDVLAGDWRARGRTVIPAVEAERDLVVELAESGFCGAVTGIGVSVVQQQSPGPVRIEGNIISGAAQPMVGTEWEKVVSNDLAADAASYPNIIVGSNTIS